MAAGDGSSRPRPPLTVAIAWRSRWSPTSRRRLPAIGRLGAGGRVPGSFVALQYGRDWAAEARRRRDFGTDLAVLDSVDTTDDMEEVFAIAAAADLVICPSSTVGWIGGAVGRDTWLLLTGRPTSARRHDSPAFQR